MVTPRWYHPHPTPRHGHLWYPVPPVGLRPPPPLVLLVPLNDPGPRVCLWGVPRRQSGTRLAAGADVQLAAICEALDGVVL